MRAPLTRTAAAFVALSLASPALAVPPTPALVTDTRCAGAPNAGTLRGGVELKSRVYMRIKPSSLGAPWGHPLLVQLLARSSFAVAREYPGSVALLGDLSAESGGFLAGHASHQSGRDADVGFYFRREVGGELRPFLPPRFLHVDREGRARGARGVSLDLPRTWRMLRVWLTDLRVEVRHVFVAPHIRSLLLDYAKEDPELRALVPLASRVLSRDRKHTDHFHLRIGCPLDQGRDCREHSVSD